MKKDSLMTNFCIDQLMDLLVSGFGHLLDHDTLNGSRGQWKYNV